MPIPSRARLSSVNDMKRSRPLRRHGPILNGAGALRLGRGGLPRRHREPYLAWLRRHMFRGDGIDLSGL
jgi:hypothetical protein